MPKTIQFKGKPVTLVGRGLKIKENAPEFEAVTADLKESGLFDFQGKIKLIMSFPSLDTPVCDLQVKEFNKRAAALSSEVRILGISKDLPFAQKRFCDAFAVKNISLLSDYKSSSFGINYGLLIKELNLLARAAVILDKNNLIRCIQVAAELSAALDYEEIMRRLQEVINTPAPPAKEGLPAKCRPCEGGVLPLPAQRTEELIARLPQWRLAEDKKIVKELKFKDFAEAKYFLDLVSLIAEEQGHHPLITLNYNKLKITLTTHAAGGLTENDFIMAGIIDSLGPA